MATACRVNKGGLMEQARNWVHQKTAPRNNSPGTSGSDKLKQADNGIRNEEQPAASSPMAENPAFNNINPFQGAGEENLAATNRKTVWQRVREIFRKPAEEMDELEEISNNAGNAGLSNGSKKQHNKPPKPIDDGQQPGTSAQARANETSEGDEKTRKREWFPWFSKGGKGKMGKSDKNSTAMPAQNPTAENLPEKTVEVENNLPTLGEENALSKDPIELVRVKSWNQPGPSFPIIKNLELMEIGVDSRGHNVGNPETGAENPNSAEVKEVVSPIQEKRNRLYSWFMKRLEKKKSLNNRGEIPVNEGIGNDAASFESELDSDDEKENIELAEINREKEVAKEKEKEPSTEILQPSKRSLFSVLRPRSTKSLEPKKGENNTEFQKDDYVANGHEESTSFVESAVEPQEDIATTRTKAVLDQDNAIPFERRDTWRSTKKWLRSNALKALISAEDKDENAAATSNENIARANEVNNLPLEISQPAEAAASQPEAPMPENEHRPTLWRRIRNFFVNCMLCRCLRRSTSEERVEINDVIDEAGTSGNTNIGFSKDEPDADAPAGKDSGKEAAEMLPRSELGSDLIYPATVKSEGNAKKSEVPSKPVRKHELNGQKNEQINLVANLESRKLKEFEKLAICEPEILESLRQGKCNTVNAEGENISAKEVELAPKSSQFIDPIESTIGQKIKLEGSLDVKTPSGTGLPAEAECVEASAVKSTRFNWPSKYISPYRGVGHRFESQRRGPIPMADNNVAK